MKRKQFSGLVQDKTITQASHEAATMIVQVFDEAKRAELKHPDFANNLSDALLVVGEELGEAQRAYLQFMYEGADAEEVRKELIQTAATIFRLMLNFDTYVNESGLDRIKQAFYDSLKGEKGDTDMMGVAGQKGDQGTAGRDGVVTFPGDLYKKITGRAQVEINKYKAGILNRRPDEECTYSFIQEARQIFKPYDPSCLCEICDSTAAIVKENRLKATAIVKDFFSGEDKTVYCGTINKDALQKLYSCGKLFAVDFNKMRIMIDPRKNRIKFTHTEENLPWDNTSKLVDFVCNNLPKGFTYSHSLTNANTSIVIAKRFRE